MKRTTLGMLALLLLSGAAAVAQDKPASSQDHPAAFSAKPLNVSGKVSSDGKILLTDIDTQWSISNPDALKGHEGHLVRVKCYVDTEKNSVKVLSVKRADSEASYAAQHSDSAFRR